MMAMRNISTTAICTTTFKLDSDFDVYGMNLQKKNKLKKPKRSEAGQPKTSVPATPTMMMMAMQPVSVLFILFFPGK